MNHLAALLMSMTIMVTPVANLVCVGSCSESSANVGPECHHQMPVARDADADCAGLLATTLFIREEGPLISAAVMPASIPSAISTVPGETGLATVHDVASAAFYRPASSLVLRL